MSFNFGTPKSATGFTLPTATVAATPVAAQYNFGGAGGDLSAAQNTAQSKPLGLFGTPAQTATAVPSTIATIAGLSTIAPTSTPGFGFAAPVASTAPQFSLGSSLATSLAAPAPTSAATFGFGAAAPSTSIAPSTGFSLGTSTLGLGAAPTATTLPLLNFGGLGSLTTSTSAPAFSLGALTTTTTAGASALPPRGTLTFAQLEDAINKWTIDLDEQGKVFSNQAKHLNAWDRLLMSNGEKILSVSNGVERIKQQQQQLDQELDFVLAQQKELEDCIVPLEKELEEVPITDIDRDQTYKLAENIDAQLKQMSEDLKEIIEHLNESNKSQELSDPVAQIGRILNAHMNSLHWIDRNTSQIGSHLDEIAKMHDLNRRNHENIHGA